MSNTYWPKVKVKKFLSGIIEYWCHQVRMQSIIQCDTQLLLLLLLIILLLEECWMEFNWQMLTWHSSWNEIKNIAPPVVFFFFWLRISYPKDHIWKWDETFNFAYISEKKECSNSFKEYAWFTIMLWIFWEAKEIYSFNRKY